MKVMGSFINQKDVMIEQGIVEAFPVMATNRIQYKLEIPTELEFNPMIGSNFLVNIQNNPMALTPQEYYFLDLGFRAYDEKDLKRDFRHKSSVFGMPANEALLMNCQFLSKKYEAVNAKEEYKKTYIEAIRKLVKEDCTYEQAHMHMLSWFLSENYKVEDCYFSFYQLYAATMKWHSRKTWPHDHFIKGRPVYQMSEYKFFTEGEIQAISRNISIHAHKQLVGFINETATKQYLQKITGQKVHKSSYHQDRYQNIDFILADKGISVKSGKSLGYKCASYYTHGKHDFTVGFKDIKLNSENNGEIGFPSDNSCDVRIKDLEFSNFIIKDTGDNIITEMEFLQELGV